MPLQQVPSAMLAGDAALPLPAGSVTLSQLVAAVQQSLVPAGAVVPFAGSTAPTSWLLCAGQAVSRTTYAALFAVIGTVHGAGDGTTTFNLPDLRGRVIAGDDDMNGTAANRLQVALSGTTTSSSAVVTGLSSTSGLAVGMNAYGSTLPAGVTIASIDSGTQVTLSTGVGVTAGTGTALRFGFLDPQALGSAGGSQIQTLTTPQIPAHTHTLTGQSQTVYTVAGAGAGYNNLAGTLTTSSVGGGQAHANVQPTMVLNYIIKT